MPSMCLYWDCEEQIQSDHFLCRDHYDAWKDNLLDRCPKCRRFKDRRYLLCLDCQRGRPAQVVTRQDVPDQPPPSGSRTPEAWDGRDKEASHFCIYILKLAGGGFYVGQTRELRERLSEHKDGRVPSTAGRNPRLQWFATVRTREEAIQQEADLERLKDANPREIRRMLIEFKDMVEELKFD